MKTHHFTLLSIAFCTILFWLSACGPTINQIKPPQTLNVDQQFQKQLTPIPTVPPYRCGAWTPNNMPNANSSINIYARLTKGSVSGSAGVPAQAIVHLQSGNVLLDEQPKSNTDGYVTFHLFLAGRQPHLVPATIDITFNTPMLPTTCTAFFTPQ